MDITTANRYQNFHVSQTQAEKRNSNNDICLQESVMCRIKLAAILDM